MDGKAAARELKALGDSGEPFWAKAFEYLAQRKQDRSRIIAAVLSRATGVGQRNAVKFTRKIDEIGFGTFKHGRHGKKTRVENLQCSLREIGEAGLGLIDEIELWTDYEDDDEIGDDAADSVEAREDTDPDTHALQAALIEQHANLLATALKIPRDRVLVTVTPQRYAALSPHFPHGAWPEGTRFRLYSDDGEVIATSRKRDFDLADAVMLRHPEPERSFLIKVRIDHPDWLIWGLLEALFVEEMIEADFAHDGYTTSIERIDGFGRTCSKPATWRVHVAAQVAA